jgi:hypothetical protein
MKRHIRMKKIAIGAITEYDATPISNGRNHAMIGTLANSGAIQDGTVGDPRTLYIMFRRQET